MSGFLISSLAKTDASAFTENILPMVSRVPTEEKKGLDGKYNFIRVIYRLVNDLLAKGNMKFSNFSSSSPKSTISNRPSDV